MSRFRYSLVNSLLLVLCVIIAVAIIPDAFDLEPIALLFGAFFLLTDIVDIRTRRVRLVTNFAGAVPFVVFSNPYALPFVAGLLSLIKEPTNKQFRVSGRLFRGLQYFVMYGTAVLVVNWSWNPYLCMIVFALVAKLVNSLLTDVVFHLIAERAAAFSVLTVATAIELIFFNVLSVFGALLWTLHQAGFGFETVLLFMVFPSLLFLLRFYADFRTTALEREENINSLNSLRYKLSKILEMISFLRTNPDFEQSLNSVAAGVVDHLGYRYCLISMFDRRKDLVKRIAHAGLSEDDFYKLQSNPPPVSYVEQFFEHKFRISRSYFVPEGSASVETVYSFRGEYHNLIESESDWRPEDILIIPIWKSNDIIGYISADAPLDGKRPRYEEIELLEIIADQTMRIIEESRVMDELLKATKIDMATGLFTHTEFYSFVSGLVRENGKLFSIIMIDIDDFKKVNDVFGHIVGDRLIEYFAKTIKTVLRREDFAARYGGDEFAAVVVEASKRDAMHIAKRITEKLQRIKVDGAKLNVTCSMGIAEYPLDGTSVSEVVGKADDALYKAKRAGKDMICVV